MRLSYRHRYIKTAPWRHVHGESTHPCSCQILSQRRQTYSSATGWRRRGQPCRSTVTLRRSWWDGPSFFVDRTWMCPLTATGTVTNMDLVRLRGVETSGWDWKTYTASRARYNALPISRGQFSPNNSRHSSPVRARYGCLSWVRSVTKVLPSKLLCCVQ